MCIYALSKLFRCMLSEESLLTMSRKYVQFRLLPTCELVEVAQVFVSWKRAKRKQIFFIYHGQVAALHCNETRTRQLPHNVNWGLQMLNRKITFPTKKAISNISPGAYLGNIHSNKVALPNHHGYSFAVNVHDLCFCLV